jgi:hypothetical protein
MWVKESTDGHPAFLNRIPHQDIPVSHPMHSNTFHCGLNWANKSSCNITKSHETCRWTDRMMYVTFWVCRECINLFVIIQKHKHEVATYTAQCSLRGGKPYWGATASGVARCLYESAGRNDNEYTPPEAYLDQSRRTSLGNRNDHLKITK